MLKNCLGIFDEILKGYEGKEIVACDMTLGNGNDIRKLKDVLSHNSKLYGFDIQEISITNTKEKFSKDELLNMTLILDSHEYVDNYVDENIDLAVYNLGYLPKGDKSIVTDYKKVIKSLRTVLEKLNVGGKIIITFYPGHKSGKEEAVYIQEYLSELDQKMYEVLKFDFINQNNQPPFLITVEKIK